MDTILFSLLVLRGLSDSRGRVWRCHPNQLYAIEVTLPNREKIPERDQPESQTLSLLKLLPEVSCISPRKVMEHLDAEKTGMSSYIQCNIPEFLLHSIHTYYCMTGRAIGEIFSLGWQYWPDSREGQYILENPILPYPRKCNINYMT